MNRQVAVRENFRVPFWAWLFVAACGAVLTFASNNVLSTLQILVGFCGAIACVWIAQDTTKPTHLRVLLCVSISVMCWLAFATLAISIAVFYR